MIDKKSPEQLSSEGKQAFKEGNFTEASDLFKAASEGFHQAGDLINAAENENNRSVALVRLGDYDGAIVAAVGTPAVFEAAGDLRKKAMALGNLGNALSHADRKTEAIEAYEQGADIFKQIGDHELRAPLMEALALIKLKHGQQMDAALTMSSGLGEYQKLPFHKRILKKFVELPIKHIFKLG
jgi:tetratricopeptide (TPR) repeat protein